MAQLDDLPPEEHRRRYEALLAGARERAGLEMPAPADLHETAVLSRETIPGGWYHTLTLRRGEALRLVNTHGTKGVSVLMWNAADPSERFSAADTMKVQWTARIRGGRVLLSDMGRVMTSIIADDCGWHDALLGGSTPTAHGLRNTRDNLLLAAGKHGLGARAVSPCITFFAGVQTTEAGGFIWRDDVVRAGTAVDLLAAMDLLVAISNCPHPLCPEPAAHPIDALVWRPADGADRIARHAGPEAARAFENTERVYGR